MMIVIYVIYDGLFMEKRNLCGDVDDRNGFILLLLIFAVTLAITGLSTTITIYLFYLFYPPATPPALYIRIIFYVVLIFLGLCTVMLFCYNLSEFGAKSEYEPTEIDEKIDAAKEETISYILKCCPLFKKLQKTSNKP